MFVSERKKIVKTKFERRSERERERESERVRERERERGILLIKVIVAQY